MARNPSRLPIVLPPSSRMAKGSPMDRMLISRAGLLRRAYHSPKTEDFLSYRDVGLMEELSKSTAWVPKFDQVKKIKKVAVDEALRKRNVEMAKTLKKRKVDFEIISATTGLTKEEIEKL